MNTRLPVMLLKGLGTYVPGLYRPRSQPPEGPSWTRYCYSVWLRHLTLAWKNGFKRLPEAVAELGPGPSLGVGLAAMLSGANTYCGLDVVAYTDYEREVGVFDEMVELFRRREPIPDSTAFPRLRPFVESYEFPREILPDSLLERTMSEERVGAIRAALRNSGVAPDRSVSVLYFAPWSDPEVVQPQSVDMVFSQAALLCIDKLEEAYEAMRIWLRPGGLMSHQISFDSLRTSSAWNGHWAYSDFVWKLIRGKRPYLINREPYSTHLEYHRKYGFKIISLITMRREGGIPRSRLAKRFRDMADEDFSTAGAFIQATKEPLA